MLKENIIKLLDEYEMLFLESIKESSDFSMYRMLRKKTPGFAILKPADESFYQYHYFEELLETYIREKLVNPLIAQLLYDSNIEAYWPDNYGYCGYNNYAIEEKFPVEFYIPKEKIGYRYTSIDLKEEKRILRKYKLEKIMVINWAGRKSFGSSEHRISVEDFFERYWGKENAIIIIESLTNTVAKANEIIGFKAISNYSNRYMSSLRNKICMNLQSTNFFEMTYQSLDGDDFFEKSVGKISDDDFSILEKNYADMFKVLVGNNEFAKCFMTAEYLFLLFQKESKFEFTSVVTGYLKSVEQLIYSIINFELDNLNEKEELLKEKQCALWIKANGNLRWKKDEEPLIDDEHYWDKGRFKSGSRARMVRLIPKYREYFDISLRPLINCLYDNNMFVLSKKGNEQIYKLLIKYSKECRNDHFHKDNIDDYSDVEKIRNNTLLVLFLILGGTIISKNGFEAKKYLGIIDDSFSELYKKVVSLPTGITIILQFNDSTKVRVKRIYYRDSIHYDELGLLNNNRLDFILVDNYKGNPEEKVPDYVISKANMPQRVWYEKHGGEQVEIIWK